MGEEVQGGNSHTAGYLDGAPAEAAFQGLIDKGLFNDAATKAPAVPPQPAAAVASAGGELAVGQAPSPEPEPPEFTSLDDYLTKSGIERAGFLELPVTVKVDGQESQVPLATLLRTYQTDAHVTQKSQALSESQKKWEGEQVQAREALTQQLSVAQKVAQLAHQQLTAEFQGIDWPKLQAEDPARWSQMRLQLGERMNAIQQHMQQLGQVQQQQQFEAQQRHAQQIEVERSKMLETFPEWRDNTKFQAATGQIKTYLQSIGFNEAEISGIADHRYMKVLMDASRGAALQAKTPAVLKMVRATPAMPAPGARMTRDPKSQRLQQVREAGRAGRLARNEDAQTAAFGALLDAGA